MEFSRQEYWSGLPFPSPGALSDPGIELGSPTKQADSLPSELPGKQRKKKLLSVEESAKALLRKAFKLSLEKESRFINIEMDGDIPGLWDFQSKDGRQGVRASKTLIRKEQWIQQVAQGLRNGEVAAMGRSPAKGEGQTQFNAKDKP